MLTFYRLAGVSRSLERNKLRHTINMISETLNHFLLVSFSENEVYAFHVPEQ